MSVPPQPGLPLLYAYLFSADGLGHEIDAQTAMEWLKQGDGKGAEFVWLHCHEFPAAVDGLAELHLDLPESFAHTLLGGSHSTRIAHMRHSLVAVINDVEFDFERKKPLEVATLWVNVGARCLLSVHDMPLPSLDGLRRAIGDGRSFHSPLALLIYFLHQQADMLFHIFRSAALTANRAEEALLQGKLPKRSSLGGIRRDLVRLRRLLAPEPAALFRLISRSPTWVREDDVQSLHQTAEDFALAVRDMAGLQERIKLLEEEIADRVGEHTNRSVLILTAVTVIALPINLIAALLGMNVGGIPLRADSHGFWIVVALSLALTGLAMALILRLRRDEKALPLGGIKLG